MGIHKFHSKAVRLNGFTDGIVVPTGQYKESGVNLLRPSYSGGATSTMSQATKIGRLHLPSENNPLNRILGPFTIDAFIVPDYGGVIVDKPGCFTLSYGNPFSAGPMSFTTQVIGNTFTLKTPFDAPVLTESNSGAYSGGEHKPHEMTQGAQPLVMVTAQFTGNRLRLFINAEIVATLNLGEDFVLNGDSSDLFIGGKGGEYRGIIESVRVSRGVVDPSLSPLLVTDETVGLWDFDDEIDVPNIHFFDNARETSPTQGRDGYGDHDGMIDKPLVFIGYDFFNSGDYGYISIYDPPNLSTNKDGFTALEKMAAYATGIELKDIREQSWSSGTLSLSSSTLGGTSATLDYITGSKGLQSTINAVINQSGTHPSTGTTSTSSSLLKDLSSGSTIAASVTDDLDPMVNPIERVRVVAIDFANNRLQVQSVHLANAASSGGIENHPKSQGLLFSHSDGTPVWITYGNADLLIDPGNQEVDSGVSNQVTRQKDAFTRAVFTQGQRFTDRSNSQNTAYFMSKQSRIATTGTAAPTTSVVEPDPPKGSLVMWLAANALSGYTDGDSVTYFPDQSGNKFSMYGVGGPWKYEASSSFFNGFPCLKAHAAASLINIDTDDGESERFTHANGDSISVFMLIRPIWDNSHAIDLFGDDASSSNKTFLSATKSAGTYTFTNNGTSTALGAIPTENAVLLVSATMGQSSTNATVFHHGIQQTVFTGKVTGNTLLNQGLLTFFGRGGSTNTSAKTGVTTNKAPADFRVAEVLIYNKDLTTVERNAVHGYIVSKYGLL
jgi:hypothetical protein